MEARWPLDHAGRLLRHIPYLSRIRRPERWFPGTALATIVGAVSVAGIALVADEQPVRVGAYGNIEAHPQINRSALDLFDSEKDAHEYLRRASLSGEPTWGVAWDANDGIQPILQNVAVKKKKSARQWIIDGGFSADEPEGPQALRHFYDPTDRTTPWLTDIVVSTVVRNPEISLLDWVGDKDDPSLAQDYSWPDAKEYFRNALADATPANELYGKAWRGVGETVHAIGDLALPAHVRNDGHAKELGDPDPVEVSTTANIIESQASGEWAPLNYDQDVLKLMHDLAAWTNANFLSKDTVPLSGNTATANGKSAYAGPTWVGLSADADGYISNTVDSRATRMVRESLLFHWGLTKTPTYVVDRAVVRDQQKLLIPTMVRAGEAVIRRFLPQFEVRASAAPEPGATGRYTVRGEIIHHPTAEWPNRLTVRNGAYVLVDGKRTGVKLGAARDLNSFTLTISADAGSEVVVAYDLGGYLIESEPVTLAGTTPTTTSTVAARTATAGPASGQWVLKSTEPTTRKDPTSGCYNSPEVTVSGLSGTTSTRCTWPSPKVDVVSQTQHSFSAAPPQVLKPGDRLRITATVSVTGNFSSANLGTSGVSGVRIDLIPGGGPYPGGAAAQASEGATKSATSDFTIPAGGKRGDKLVLSYEFHAGNASLSGVTRYTYEWQLP